MNKLFTNISNKLKQLKGVIYPGLSILGLFIILSFVNKKTDSLTCNQVQVSILSSHNNNFYNEDDVKQLVKNYFKGPVEGKKLNEINLFDLENEIDKKNFIQKSQVYYSIRTNSKHMVEGVLHIDVIHRTPILRIKANNGDDYYVDWEGEKMPISAKYSAKTLVFTGNIAKSDFDKETKSPYYQLAKTIQEDAFLKALIGQVYINSRGEIFLVPKLGNIIIEYGNTNDTEIKVKKLKILYKKILPAQGWKKYKQASLKYKNQIVLKKR